MSAVLLRSALVGHPLMFSQTSVSLHMNVYGIHQNAEETVRVSGYILSSTVSDGKQSVSGEIAAPCGKVFIIKCDFLHPHQTTGKRIRQAISCSCCSAFHLCPSFFTGLREKYADFELGGLAIN